MRDKNKILVYILVLYMVISALYLVLTGSIGSMLYNSVFVKNIKKTVLAELNTINIKYVAYKNKLEDLQPMIIYRPNDKELEVYSLLSDRNILLTKFSKKSWGTWNILGWYIARDGAAPTKDPYLMAGGDTDWEYVFRVSESQNDKYTFSGGNHGNELIKNIMFINGDTDEELKLDVGQKIIIYNLKIIEKTSLTSDDRIIKNYADVERKYLISHAQINLETDFNFTSDIFMGTSYVCMFPIEKKVGRFAKFNDINIIYQTPDIGQTYSSYTYDNYLGKEKTLSVDIWGESNPKYRFNVWISNSKMVDNFSNELKTFYWDLNKGANKLYFSKFNSDDYKKIEKGTKWHNEQGWKLNILK